MPQPLRPNPPGWFHVMNRGARRWDVFIDDEDRRLFLDLLAGIRIRFDVRVVSYCLMGNHFHLVLHCPEPALSRSMQWLGSKYTRQFNKRHGFDGPLCRARFKSVEVLDDPQLVAVVRYVHRNPFDLALNSRLSEYEWSSYAAYLGLVRGPWWLETGVPMGLFNDDRRAFQRVVETAMDYDAVQNRLSPLNIEEHTKRQTRQGPTRLREIEKAVAEAASCKPREVCLWAAGRPNPLFDAALVLASEGWDSERRSVLNSFGYASDRTLNSAVSRVQTKLKKDIAFARLVAEARLVLRGSIESKVA